MEESMSLIEAGKEAIIVQDGSNLSGIVYSFASVLEALWMEATRIGVGALWVNCHPVSKLYCYKMADLSKANSFEDFCEAYAECRKLAFGPGSVVRK
jgi:hypothetical protein